MRNIILSLLLLFLLADSSFSQVLTRWVNPFIGTGAVESSLSGNNYPGATVPFGMVQLSPDTREAPDWAQASGYDYNDSTIYGFSHTRLSGTGASDFIDILMFPTQSNKRQSAFTHEQESARPGYYQVMLADEGIQAELTASTRVGVHRYTYPQKGVVQVWLDLDHSANKGSWGRRIIQSQIRVVSPTIVEGYRIITGWAKLRKVYFHIEFSMPILTAELSDGDRKYKNTPVINGTNLHGLFSFNRGDHDALIAKVALSPVSIENALLNMTAEVPAWDFEEVSVAAEQSWEKELAKIQVQGTDLQKTIFYTALYHTMVQPNTMSDVNGEYMATDYTTRRLKVNETHYSTFSLWDTFRAAHPLYTLLHMDKTEDFIKSMVRQYDDYGYLPIWQLWGQDNYCMIGNHSIPVIVDAVLKGIAGVDAEKAYEAVRNSSLVSHPNSPFEVWEKYGYMPENIQTQSVSITLEQAYDDWCVAQLAKKLGKEEDYHHFMKRSAYYRNLFNPTTGFFQPKSDKGEWIVPFDPYKYGANGGYPFTEGNAWQYFWYVPQNIPDLIALTGGNKAFTQKLDAFFTTIHQSGELNDNASGFVGQYAHGNEPSHHVAYLYAYAGQAWKTQKYVAHIMDNLYNISSSGYAGNDDCGEMSAWYIFGALGFYPVNPASGEYVIGTPMLEQAVIQLPDGKHFTVKAPRKRTDEIYIRSMKLNGKKYTKTTITHQDILNGGILECVMSARPNRQ
ncbi:GH92 family glycosyl hydrolase [Bacteroides sp.]|uniref:GH92 family glycosyl hydrolase n=1 Tax=Bacteroides sp. TaxID=29523 RepID=UPI002638A278|nr:GH92 family glycosyl hydrolase [Bacteroides sp.]